MALKFSIPRHVVAKFARDKRGNPIGLAVATQGPSGEVTVGWSWTAKVDRKNGSINKSCSWAIALDRAVTGTNRIIPYALRPIINEVSDRAKRYFRVDRVKVVGRS